MKARNLFATATVTLVGLMTTVSGVSATPNPERNAWFGDTHGHSSEAIAYTVVEAEGIQTVAGRDSADPE